MTLWRATALLAALTVAASGCSNYKFRRGPFGQVDVEELMLTLEHRPDGKAQLRQDFWVPLLYRQRTVFQRTRNPAFQQGGFTLYEEHSVGPLSVLWSSHRVTHYDAEGAVYHVASEKGIGRRLGALYKHRVRTEKGSFEFHQAEILFGILRTQQEGFPQSVTAWIEKNEENWRRRAEAQAGKARTEAEKATTSSEDREQEP